MAPQSPPSSTLIFDSRTQIIDNCEFLISKDDIVQVITSKSPVNKLFKAHAVKCNEDTRELMLVSEPCETAQKAVESLHAKSCEAVHQYILTNGFSAPRDLKMASLEPIFDDDGDDDDAASIVSGHSDSSTAALSEWGSSGDEAMLLHDNNASGPDEAPKDRQHPAGCPGKKQVAATAVNSHEPWEEPPRIRAVRPAQSRSPSFAFRQAPPPPPPGYPAPPKSDGPPAPPPSMRGIPVPPPLPHPYVVRMGPGPRPPLRQQHGMKPPISPAQPLTCFRLPGLPTDRPPFPASQGGNRPPMPPNINVSNSGSIKRSEHSYNPPRPGTVFHPSAGMYTVGIMVHWIGHGQHRIISSVHPTFQALQNLAIADVRMHPERFTSEGSNMKGFAGSSNRDGDRSGLAAHVTKVIVSGEKYDMQGFHNPNLATLLDVLAIDGMPSFEVIVTDVPPHDDEDSG
ncbi:hypothetical protein FHL15_008330 [Xylaria flabelliformis]|uniref:Uncharacterized protein n=1 Tax=Xylaria flabelliformis TaxID=2512241 RepID=A0A553HS27_9PEZI|nr:hypothetical protein FHL15_008330 [Xylaria flabelliformis]